MSDIAMEFYGIDKDKRICEVCGGPATHIVQDLEADGYDVGDDGKKWARMKLHSLHLFRVNHKREPFRHGVLEK